MTEEKLSPEAKELLERRMKANERITKAAQVAEVVKAMASVAPDPAAEVKSIIGRESPAKENFILDVVRTYRREKPKQSVTEFFNQRYKDKALVLMKPSDAIRDAIRSYDVKPAVGNEPAIAGREVVEEKPEPKKPSQPQANRTGVILSSGGDRVEMLAMLIGEHQKIPVDAVKKTEVDTIKRIMNIVDQNQSLGISDEDVLRACISLVEDEKTETKFILEALEDGNRDELLKRAAATGKAR